MNVYLMTCALFLSAGQCYLATGHKALKKDNAPQTLVPGSLHVREMLSLKTAILFHFINHYGFCKPRKMRTNLVKKCFQNIHAACRIVGEGTRSMGALKNRTNLGRLCSLAHKARGVTEWFTMAAQVAEALCATCTELATEEEKTTCEKRLCQ